MHKQVTVNDNKNQKIRVETKNLINDEKYFHLYPSLFADGDEFMLR
jgi:hypothetical protein